MGLYTDHSNLYSKLPLTSGENRDEHFLVEVLGSWIPECELMYYGLLGSKYSNDLYKLRNMTRTTPRDAYLETCFFSGDDLIKYLASEDNSFDIDLPEEFLQNATMEALDKYFYVPCSETMIRHSIIELTYFDFCKSVTLIFPWDIRPIDYAFLNSVIPESRMSKFKLASGDTLDFLKSNKNSETKYTTLITNDLDTVNTLIDENETYGTESTLFLLRNSSKNTEAKIFTNDEGKQDIEFNELGNEIIIPKLMDVTKGIPKNQMRFGRFDPHLFDDLKPDEKEFSYGV